MVERWGESQAWALVTVDGIMHIPAMTSTALCTQRKEGDMTTRVMFQSSCRMVRPTRHACSLPLSVSGGSQGRSDPF
jgi:hypothetical protein